MIICVRHPPPSISASVCYGQLDVALAEPAETHVRAIASPLPAMENGRIVTSPLRRARELADVLAQQVRAELIIEPRLMEMSFGAWEGVPWAEIAREQIDAWAADPLGYRTGGGETVNELAGRVGQFWDEASSVRQPQVWVTHAGPMRCLAALSQGSPLSDCLARKFSYGEALVLRASRQA